MGGYTQKNEIYLSADEAEYLARAFQADPEFDADDLEYLIHFGRGLISHEVFHCLTRNNAEFRYNDVTKSNVHRKWLYNGIKVSSHSNCDTIILFIQRDILNLNVILPVIESKTIFRALN